MSITNGQPAWHPPYLQHTNSNRSISHLDDVPARTQTPVDNSSVLMPEAQLDIEDENRRALFADLYRKTEDKVALLFSEDGSYNYPAITALRRSPPASHVIPPTTDHEPIKEPPLKKAKRTIDEDDYDDDEDEEEEDEPSQLVFKPHSAVAPANTLLSPSKSGSSPVHSVTSPGKHGDKPKDQDGSQPKDKDGEDSIKKLEEARTATEAAARRSFHTIFHTLENDRAAMLEQQQLEDSEKQLQAEMDHNHHPVTNHSSVVPNQGSLSSANLGASSLTLKHLIARIDMKRDQVRASDAELRLLMNEVRKNRSKWASEENVNQEELYEALEKVLTELKAHTEYSTPFLTRVNKRDAPDYYNFIKNPMDLGTMTKKLKSLNYKSKADFVVDLNLIWDNCLRYNQDMNHPLRRMANGMRKEAEKLIPLIPDLAIRSRAEVEAEERRKQNGGDDDAGEDSDDEPIMSSRGRKAGVKGASKARKAPNDQKEDTPAIDQKPILQVNGLVGKVREDSEVDGSNGFGTPPVAGSLTPGGVNGHSGIASNADAMDIDGPSINGLALNSAFGEAVEQVFEDEEYKVWKQTTKKDRALVAKERFQLFKDNKFNTEAPALLRTKAGMRRFLKRQREAEAEGIITNAQANSTAVASESSATKPTETLAEEIEEEAAKVIPDYYDTLSNIPDIHPKLQWIEDSEGQVINQHEEFLRLVPAGTFVAPPGRFTKKMDENIHQIQETRKLATRISVIKQMQVQTQVYTNQFPKSNSDPFVEQDIEPHFISDDGPVMANETCQEALKRSIAKVLYHTGFEELQPSAMDTFTGVVGDYFHKLVRTFNLYNEAEKEPTPATVPGARFQPKFTPEEVILHTLDENGHDISSLELYAKDEIDRLSTKLDALHERMKLHLTDLLRPALSQDAGADGVGAFKDGSEQFVSGDFAEDLGEDFFGFRALGLDKEMGLDMISVPLHLLQTRVRNQYQMQTQTTGETATDLFDPLPNSEPVTKENIQDQVGLVKNFFLAKLHANGDQPLVEDEDLPTKQKKPRPRLGASGKIVTAQKRSPKEQLALAKKKKKMEAAAAEARANANASPDKGGANATPGKKKSMNATTGSAPNPAVLALAPSMERQDSMQSQGNNSQTDKDDTIGMMSPESIAQ
ncbi:related to transcription regulator SPT7 [Fusarium torulosum]|uniref:SAGA complex subunit Spt7 n=1 Tax=Fusarium torulosum TaxID=33205 RepID=A0AAE8SLY6_9HYPO|nr:related to transcription regulator SPT7 [Fusarium torulosum]